MSFLLQAFRGFFFLNKRRVRYLDPPVELTIIQAHKLVFSRYPVFATHKKACFFFFFFLCVSVTVMCVGAGVLFYAWNSVGFSSLDCCSSQFCKFFDRSHPPILPLAFAFSAVT